MNKDVTRTDRRCPRADLHKTDKNVFMLRRQDGSEFCAVHGDFHEPTGAMVKTVPIR